MKEPDLPVDTESPVSIDEATSIAHIDKQPVLHVKTTRFVHRSALADSGDRATELGHLDQIRVKADALHSIIVKVPVSRQDQELSIVIEERTDSRNECSTGLHRWTSFE